MSTTLIVLIVILLTLAALTGEDFIFKLLYMIAGVYLLGRFWSSRTAAAIRFNRHFTTRAFPKEEVRVQLAVSNPSVLPIIWLRVQDLLPLEISPTRSFQQVISLAPKETVRLNYLLKASKRGYYPVGPLRLTTGDILGLAQDEKIELTPDHLTVYPRVVPLRRLNLPSHSPMGTLKHHQPVYEDPTRPAGKRDYQQGDSLRRIDWKSSAVRGQLQVKQFEPSISLQIALVLNLNVNEYHYRKRIDATELAIVTAASVASWAITQKQSAGLITNGMDPLGFDGQAQPLKIEKGRGHLMRLLEMMARVKIREGEPLKNLIRENRTRLAWGTTLVVITGQVDDALFEEFFQAQREGMDVAVIICGEYAEYQQVKQRARRYHIPVAQLWSEQDLEQWRGW